MRKIQAYDAALKSGSALLIDLSSLNEILAEKDNLSSSNAHGIYRARLQASDYHTLALFETLSNFICFDRFLVDYRALFAYQDGEKLLDLLKATGFDEQFLGVLFPETVYETATQEVMKLRNSIIEKAPKTVLKATTGDLEKLFGSEETMGVDDATLKDMYDRRNFLLRRPDFDFNLPRNFADTGMSVERLFVYLEISRSIDVPASLARSKYKSLDEVGKRARAVASAIEANLARQRYGTETGLAEAQELVQKTALPKVTLPAPPLPTYLLRLAEKQNCSIFDAVRFLRDEPAATAFREYVWENRKAFNPSFAADHLKAKELNKTLSDIGKRIAKAGSPTGAFKDMKSIKLRISNIPILGELLKMVGVRSVKIPVTVPRNPPLYEVFIARWFS